MKRLTEGAISISKTTMKRLTEGAISISKRLRRMEKQRRHLYLVLDDWSCGYSIRKIDLSFDDDPSERWRSLPSAIFRFEAERGEPAYFAGAFGSKILALHPISGSGANRRPMDGVPVFDVRMQSFMFGPRRWPEPVHPIYIPVGGRLFALADGSFDLLCPPPSDGISWENFVWRWKKLPDLTFQSECVASYAVHPDGRTIFVSVRDFAGQATLSFDTVEQAIMDDGKWRQHGQWELPFSGQAYFDPELDGWVGLSKDNDGRICLCDVVSTNTDDSSNLQQCSSPLKLSKEKLFSLQVQDESLSLVGVNLIYLGGGSKFCLLEYLENAELVADVLTDLEAASKHFLRLTTFSLRYDKNGDLTMGKSRHVHRYRLPKGVTDAMLGCPVAFWM